LDSVYEKDHVRADISQFTDDAGQMMGNNLKTHLEALDRQMRDAAADLDFERAARIRDEIKRLRELELSISDDPLARYAEAESPVSGREKGKHNKGRARHRTVGEGTDESVSSPRERGEDADRQMRGKVNASEGERSPSSSPSDHLLPASKEKESSLFAKPSLDNMGPGTDMPTPAGAISRSLFKKQSAREAHGSDFGIPGDSKKSLFRKNSLDEMTVRRTEKPVPGTPPRKPPSSPLEGEMAGRPEGGAKGGNTSQDAKPIRRERAGIGSYEDPADARQHKRRPGKTGRPGH
ncbi:MAG: UvrB/UvrC motif-containing protein, partial [Pseudaminobacter sp.]